MGRGKRGPPKERFWQYVSKTPTCWSYQNVGRRGYGRMLANGKHVRAHRFSWELHFGPIPDGMIVCHKCDNPACVRPSHLYVGTDADNMLDKIRRGRIGNSAPRNPSKGERHHNTILKNADIRKMRRLYAGGGISQQAIAAMFGIHQTNVSNIVRRKWWRHVI